MGISPCGQVRRRARFAVCWLLDAANGGEQLERTSLEGCGMMPHGFPALPPAKLSGCGVAAGYPVQHWHCGRQIAAHDVSNQLTAAEGGR
jgi:hypothetical protein